MCIKTIKNINTKKQPINKKIDIKSKMKKPKINYKS